jgi:lipoprotein-anchoring transpeptidase ErfK/SrfK
VAGRVTVGLATVVAALAIGACSANSNAAPAVTVAADLATQSTHAPTSTSDPTTTAPPVTTTTTTAPAVTTTKPVPTKPPVVRKKSSVPCSTAARACVDLSARKAWLVDDGKIVYGPVSIMPGRVGWETPTGTFHVQFKDADYFSHEFQVPMPDSVFFYPGIAFHLGSLYEHSHGCVHLSRTSAAKFFHTLTVGDEVQVVR